VRGVGEALLQQRQLQGFSQIPACSIDGPYPLKDPSRRLRLRSR